MISETSISNTVSSNASGKFTKIKFVMDELDKFIPLFKQAVSEPERKSRLVELSEKLTKLYDKLREPQSTMGIAEMFKTNSEIMIAMQVLRDIRDIISFDIMQSELLMSETYVKNTRSHMTKLYKDISNALDISVSYPEHKISESDLPEIIQLRKKYPATESLFIQLMSQFRDNIAAILELEAIKHDIAVNAILNLDAPNGPAALQNNIYLNMIQRYNSYPEEGPYLKFPDIIKRELNISNTTPKDIHKVTATVSDRPIILIERSTSVLYETWKLFRPVNAKAGVSNQYIEQMTTIKRVDNSGLNSITLCHRGKRIDVLKHRKVNQFNNLLHVTQVPSSQAQTVYCPLVLDTIDGNAWKKVNIDTPHVAHMLSGPNTVIQWRNSIVESSILKHWKGAREIKWSSTHVPVAHIRQKITSRILNYFNKISRKTIKQIDDFIQDPQLFIIYNSEMFSAFIEYSSKIQNPIVGQEALVSYLSDLGIRGRRFRRELNNIYNKQRAHLPEGAPSQLYNVIEEIITQSLAASISEKDNIYNVIDEKRVLFAQYT